MQLEERDAASLWDMREAGQEVLEFIRGVNYARFASDKMLRYALERQIHVIGVVRSRDNVCRSALTSAAS